MPSLKNTLRISDSLLAKYAIGEITDDESLLVEQWMEANVKNRKEVEDLLLIMNKYKPGTPHGIKEENTAWQELQERINGSPHTPVYQFANWWKWTAAAVLVLLIGITVVLKTNNMDETKRTIVLSTIVGNGYRQDTLPDGSMVLLNKYATLAYNAGFGAAQRNIQLTGSCFFSIAHDTSRLFRIRVNDVIVTVVGTSFTIGSNAAHTTVKVHTGIVEVKKMNSMLRLVKGDSIDILPSDVILKKAVADSIPVASTRIPGKQDKKETGNHIREKQKQVIKSILADIVLMGVESTKDNVEWFGLNDTVFIVNGKKQPASIHRKISRKYAVKTGYGFYYGPVQITGKGVFMSKEDIN